jgi:arylsulfatase B/arylsulfatase I/J
VNLYRDLDFQSESNFSIPTPSIRNLSRNPSGHKTILSQYYTNIICSPSRAAFLTGRFSYATGISSALFAGSPASIPKAVPTLPELLKRHSNYRTALAGKWHLGHSKFSMTPTGRGFDEFAGCLTWGTQYFSKQMNAVPFGKSYIDWMEANADEGISRHFVDGTHATNLITREAQAMIKRHVQRSSSLLTEDSSVTLPPLFLLVAYTAAHSPLQPEEHHLAQCEHIIHPWRRRFCGLMVGLDDGIGNVAKTALSELGSNTVIVITSDNGASPWFGGLNDPFRGAKASPYEGGIHVPAFIIDYYANGSEEFRSTTYDHFFHVSDWLPTFLGLAHIDASKFPAGLDGIDTSGRIFPHRFESTKPFQPREEFLIDALHSHILKYGDNLMAYRYRDFKLIIGYCRDNAWYREDITKNYLVTSDPTGVSYAVEMILRLFESILDEGAIEILKLMT